MAEGLLLGGSGQLGSALAQWLDRSGRSVHAPPRSELDLLDLQAVARTLVETGPAWVINAAAFTDVAGAELPGNRDAAFHLNRDLPQLLARQCREHGVRFVHVSTDYVFSGTASEPYREEDAPAPRQVYGLSKLAGERAVLEADPQALVVRTSTVFGHAQRPRPNYVDAILQQARTRSGIEVVVSPFTSPTSATDLAWGLLRLFDERAAGLVHVVNDGSCSRFELAQAIVEEAGRAESVTVVSRPAPDDDIRPRYSVLDTSRYAALTGSRLRHWRMAIAEYVRESRP